MSSFDRFLSVARRRAAIFLVAALPFASACTVQPLYSNPSSGSPQAAVTADLSAIAIKPVKQRYAQQVRNHLIFLFGRGAGQPASPAYSLTLVVTAVHQSAAVVQVGDDNEPTAGTVTMTANYSLAAASSGEVVASGRRMISAQYDVPRQEFAAYRARLNAEDRAARELAELLNLTLAQELSK
ncbi:LPS assembly lipoprotein LptE [Mesorhizobium marinum]|uniref:LPS assembly lipoprotein LptE n=1 Tax=Mesorhizobium marinum TaxID=3228790 RepID=A0ABV3QYN3_9HYPH